ncbi:MAG: hypothetical protein H5T81_10895 [Tetrasphaera sp.]|nr:hypothetical protein [Tetrasphaera sp.]
MGVNLRPPSDTAEAIRRYAHLSRRSSSGYAVLTSAEWRRVCRARLGAERLQPAEIP